MEHVGLIHVKMTSSSIPYVANALHKVKSISFTIPCFADYEVIIDGLAKTNVLQCLELHLWGGFKPKYKTMNAYLKHLKITHFRFPPISGLVHPYLVMVYGFHPYLVSTWRKIQSQNVLWYGKFSTSCDGSSGSSISHVQLNIEHFKNVILPRDLPLVEESHTFPFFTPVNKKKKEAATSIDKAFALLILLQLKKQTYNLNKLNLRLSSKIKSDYDFSHKAEKYIRQVNSTRKKQGVNTPLSVNIIFEGKICVLVFLV